MASLLDTVYQDIKKALARTLSTGNQSVHSGHGSDRYVTGGMNWDGYDLPTLVSMVAEPANPAQVDAVAGLWRTNGALITQSAENLSQSLTTLLNYWQGSAADQASNAVTNTANWITAVGETAAKLANSVEDAGGALRSAQSTMPGNPTSSFWTGYSPAAGGVAAAAASGGPVGAATGALVGGLTSVFGAGAQQTALKQQAVQTMQRYEQAATTIDSTTPQFAAPVVWGAGGSGSASGGGGGGSGMSPGTGSGSSGSVGTSGMQGLGQTTVASFAGSPVDRWNGLTAGGKVGGIGAGGGSAGQLGGAGLFGGALGDGAQAAMNRQKATSSGAVANGTSGVAARTEPVGSTVLEDVGGRSAAGTPGAPGMGAPGVRGGADGDYKRRIPFEEEPFTTGLKAVPPVIGLNAAD